MKPSSVLSLAAALLAPPAMAADAPDAADIIVIGSTERLMQLSGSGAVVTSQDLARSRPFSVNDALRQVAGVFPRDEEGAGARPNICLLYTSDAADDM
jgi:Fe(3+) dicitrate transport protein